MSSLERNYFLNLIDMLRLKRYKEPGGNSRLFIAEMKARYFIVSNILYVLQENAVYCCAFSTFDVYYMYG